MADERLKSVVFVALAVLVGLQFRAIYAVDFLLTNDGPQHLLTAFVHRFYHSSPLRFDETWFINEPLTDHGYKELFWLLVSFLPWRLADRVACHAPILISTIGWLAVARWRGGAWGVRGLIVVGLSITWHYWLGFLPFAYASAFSPWILLVFLRSRLARPFDLFVFAGLLFLQAHCHPFPTMVIGVVMFVAAALARDPALAARVAAGGAPAAGLALVIASLSHATVTSAVWEFDRNIINAWFENYLPGPLAFRGALTVGLVALGSISVLGRRTLPPWSRTVMAVVGFGLLCTPLLPTSWGSWDLVGARSLVFLVPAFVSLGADPPRRVLPIVVVAASAFSASYLEWVRHQSRLVASTFGDALDGAMTHLPTLSAQEWEFQLLEVFPHPRDAEIAVPFLAPSLHFSQAVAVEKGGRPIYTQSDDRILHGLVRPVLRAAHLGQQNIHPPGQWAAFWGSFPDERERRHVEMAAHFSRMAPHQVLVVVGRDEDAEGMARSGYRVTTLGHTGRGLAVLRGDFEGCTVALDITTATADVVEVGLVPENEPIEAIPVGAGQTSLTLNRLPCGRWWVRTEHRLRPTGPAYHVADVVDGEVITLVQRGPGPRRQ